MMGKKKESGFSLIELLLVVVIVGLIAALAVPAYQKGLWAAQNGSAFGILRTINSTQLSFYTQNNRYGRLDEINRMLGNGVGTVVPPNKLVRGKYVFEMSPDNPTDAELGTEYFVSATRAAGPGETIFRYELNQTGRIIQVLPVGAPSN